MSSQVELELKDPQVDPQGELFFKDMSKQINKRYCPGCRQWVPTGNKYWAFHYGKPHGKLCKTCWNKRRKRKHVGLGVFSYVDQKVSGMRWDSKQRGIEPDRRITREYILVLLKENPECQACGRKLDMETRGKAPNRVTIDRQDNSKGYVLGNLGIICWRCNQLKKDGTLQEFKGIIAYMEGEPAG